jgi:hypothetical protein
MHAEASNAVVHLAIDSFEAASAPAWASDRSVATPKKTQLLCAPGF